MAVDKAPDKANELFLPKDLIVADNRLLHYCNTAQARGRMWILFVAGAVLSWGAYGVLLHKGQVSSGNPLKALLCVGVAYFLIGVLVPVATLSAQGGLSNFNSAGLITATVAGALGAAGAACIIYAFRTGGLPLYVMPLVFGGAPIVNVSSRWCSTRRRTRSTPCCSSGSSSRRSGPRWSSISGRLPK